ncbi:MAG: AAA family ATPase [Bacteroidales bacterium]|nr:AAA family ATPase [Bacteroidales bacterium]
MGRYINPGNQDFARVIRGEYVDKSMLIEEFSSNLDTANSLFCVSRPRRFGKSMASRMLSAYFDKSCDSRDLFAGLKIASSAHFETHLNKHNVIYLDMTSVLMQCRDSREIVPFIMRSINEELNVLFGVHIDTSLHLSEGLSQVNLLTGERFIFIIDEWDAVCRELKRDEQAFDDYVRLLRSLFKGDITGRVFEGVYMTGILPIKKYGTQSALNNFSEYTMVMPGRMAPYFGFTEDEVQSLCKRHDISFSEMKRWYDGYHLPFTGSVYNPNSVMKAIEFKAFGDFWAMTSTYEDIRDYISMNFDGLKDSVIAMLGGERVFVNPTKFQNDFNSIRSRDDVLTLLIHLGYLGYNPGDRTAYIPNYEISEELQNAVEDTSWEHVATALRNSESLLSSTLSGDEEAVAQALEQVHQENTSILQYNNENSLSCAVTIAYYSARRYYNVIREFPSGKGFADLVFLPIAGSDKPAMVVELKYAQSASGAITQILNKNYPESLKSLTGDIVLVGINYNPADKKHICRIERMARA